MATSDDLTYGQRENMSHNIRALKRAVERYWEAIETVRRTAPAIAIGLEMNASPDDLFSQLEANWTHFQTTGRWPDLGTATASAKK